MVSVVLQPNARSVTIVRPAPSGSVTLGSSRPRAYTWETRKFLRRRVWRTLRRLGELESPDFVKMAVGVLLLSGSFSTLAALLARWTPEALAKRL